MTTGFEFWIMAVAMFLAGYYVGAGIAAYRCQKHFERVLAAGRKES